jgi:hypothetical protein
VTDIALVSFLVYLVLFDFVDYGLHRAQHRWEWWWRLHALAPQPAPDDGVERQPQPPARRPPARQRDGGAGAAGGHGAGQFVAVVACTQLIESLAHANARLSFGAFGRLLVSPRFHRLHHAIGIGHESAGKGTRGGHNFAVLFPVWDMLFGTARFDDCYPPTGVRDQLPEEGGSRLRPRLLGPAASRPDAAVRPRLRPARRPGAAASARYPRRHERPARRLLARGGLLPPSRVILLSLLPVVIAGGLAWVLGLLLLGRRARRRARHPARLGAQRGLHAMAGVDRGSAFRSVLPALIVVALAVPVVVVFSLLLVAMLMTPSLTHWWPGAASRSCRCGTAAAGGAASCSRSAARWSR